MSFWELLRVELVRQKGAAGADEPLERLRAVTQLSTTSLIINAAGLQLGDRAVIGLAEALLRVALATHHHGPGTASAARAYEHLLPPSGWRILLCNNSLTDRCTAHLVLLLSRCAALAHLDLSQNPLSETALTKLAHVLQRRNDTKHMPPAELVIDHPGDGGIARFGGGDGSAGTAGTAVDIAALQKRRRELLAAEARSPQSPTRASPSNAAWSPSVMVDSNTQTDAARAGPQQQERNHGNRGGARGKASSPPRTPFHGPSSTAAPQRSPSPGTSPPAPRAASSSPPPPPPEPSPLHVEALMATASVVSPSPLASTTAGDDPPPTPLRNQPTGPAPVTPTAATSAPSVGKDEKGRRSGPATPTPATPTGGAAAAGVAAAALPADTTPARKEAEPASAWDLQDCIDISANAVRDVDRYLNLCAVCGPATPSTEGGSHDFEASVEGGLSMATFVALASGRDPQTVPGAASALLSGPDGAAALRFSGVGLGAVTILNISHNGLTALPPLPPTLTRLDCSHNALEQLDALHHCPMLVVLNARRNQLKRLTIRPAQGSLVLRPRPQQRALPGLSASHPTKPHEHSRGAFDGCAALAHLFLGHNHLTAVDGLAHLCLLETLDLSFNAIATEGAVRPLSLNTALRHIVLRGTPLEQRFLAGPKHAHPASTTVGPASPLSRREAQQGRRDGRKRYVAALRNLCSSLLAVDNDRIANSRSSEWRRIDWETFLGVNPNTQAFQEAQWEASVAAPSGAGAMAARNGSPQSSGLHTLRVLTSGLTNSTGYAMPSRVAAQTRVIAAAAAAAPSHQQLGATSAMGRSIYSDRSSSALQQKQQGQRRGASRHQRDQSAAAVKGFDMCPSMLLHPPSRSEEAARALLQAKGGSVGVDRRVLRHVPAAGPRAASKGHGLAAALQRVADKSEAYVQAALAHRIERYRHGPQPVAEEDASAFTPVRAAAHHSDPHTHDASHEEADRTASDLYETEASENRNRHSASTGGQLLIRAATAQHQAQPQPLHAGRPTAPTMRASDTLYGSLMMTGTRRRHGQAARDDDWDQPREHESSSGESTPSSPTSFHRHLRDEDELQRPPLGPAIPASAVSDQHADPAAVFLRLISKDARREKEEQSGRSTVTTMRSVSHSGREASASARHSHVEVSAPRATSGTPLASAHSQAGSADRADRGKVKSSQPSSESAQPAIVRPPAQPQRPSSSHQSSPRSSERSVPSLADLRGVKVPADSKIEANPPLDSPSPIRLADRGNRSVGADEAGALVLAMDPGQQASPIPRPHASQRDSRRPSASQASSSGAGPAIGHHHDFHQEPTAVRPPTVMDANTHRRGRALLPPPPMSPPQPDRFIAGGYLPVPDDTEAVSFDEAPVAVALMAKSMSPAGRQRQQRVDRAVSPPSEPEKAPPVSAAVVPPRQQVALSDAAKMFLRRLEDDTAAVRATIGTLLAIARAQRAELLHAAQAADMSGPLNAADVAILHDALLASREYRAVLAERDKCVVIASQDRLLHDVTVPAPIARELNLRGGAAATTASGDTSSYVAEVEQQQGSPRAQLAALIDGKTCLRYLLACIEDGREELLVAYVAAVDDDD